MASEDVTITYACTLLAEFEIVSRLPHSVAVEAHLKCLPRPLIPRILTMIRTVALVPPRMLSGSIVRSPAIPPAFEEVTGERAIVPPHPQFLGAYGAALIVLYRGRPGASV